VPLFLRYFLPAFSGQKSDGKGKEYLRNVAIFLLNYRTLPSSSFLNENLKSPKLVGRCRRSSRGIFEDSRLGRPKADFEHVE
jgi:hypothetical protein